MVLPLSYRAVATHWPVGLSHRLVASRVYWQNARMQRPRKTWRDRARVAEYWIVGAMVAGSFLYGTWHQLRSLAAWFR